MDPTRMAGKTSPLVCTFLWFGFTSSIHLLAVQQFMPEIVLNAERFKQNICCGLNRGLGSEE